MDNADDELDPSAAAAAEGNASDDDAAVNDTRLRMPVQPWMKSDYQAGMAYLEQIYGTPSPLSDATVPDFALEKRQSAIDFVDQLLDGRDQIDIDFGEQLFHATDYFIQAAAGNATVRQVHLSVRPFLAWPFHGWKELLWTNIARAFANLSALETLAIKGNGVDILTNMLQIVRNLNELSIGDESDYPREANEMRSLARVLQAHPSLQRFEFVGRATHWTIVGPLIAALGSCAHLTSVSLRFKSDIFMSVQDGSWAPLFQLPSLETVFLCGFCFNSADFNDIFTEGKGGSSLCGLSISHSEFTGRGGACFANELITNETLTRIDLDSVDLHPSFFESLRDAVTVNKTLQALEIHKRRLDPAEEDDLTAAEVQVDRNWALTLMSAFEFNHTVTELTLGGVQFDKSFGNKLRRVLENPESQLEYLSLFDPTSFYNRAWCNVVACLGVNTSLKILTIRAKGLTGKSCVETAVQLASNSSLECLEIDGGVITATDLIKAVASLRTNDTLATLNLKSRGKTICVQEEEFLQLQLGRKQNYGLESVSVSAAEEAVNSEAPSDNSWAKPALRQLSILSRLNKAGRRYLINDASSKQRAVQVLSAVNDELDCIFTHVLENPTMFERRSHASSPGNQLSGKKRKVA